LAIKSSCEAAANKNAAKSKIGSGGFYVERKSVGARSGGLPDANGSWRCLRMERLSNSLGKAISLVN
jgi:hypothetical protein